MWQKALRIILLLVVLAPLVSFLSWYFTPKKYLTAAIIDKTVFNTDGQEHISFHWVLNHNRFMKSGSEAYEVERDYFGFFPKKDTAYAIKGIERFPAEALSLLSDDSDMLYITDTYGIYKQEWYANYSKRPGVLYGGLSEKDINFIKQMKAKQKPVIAEFNCLASPTPKPIRAAFEALYHARFTGWSGRYFDSLDENVNQELPSWILTNYKNNHNGNWPFTKDGVVLVNDDSGTVVILENETHLNNPLPFVYATAAGQERFDLPEKEKYPFWFEIMESDTQVNTTYASYQLATNTAGVQELKKYGIPNTFPAVINHSDSDYDFYYLAGDFSDNPIGFTTSYFKGIGLLKSFFYNANEPSDRGGFFFNFYKPLVTQILSETYDQM